MKTKLIKLISNSLNISRRQASDLINNELVTVNKLICTEYSKEIDTKKDYVQVKNKRINIIEEFEYYAFYKPVGIETSKKGLKFYIGKIGIENLTYAGRLDKDSEGLLILSNDGDYIQKITHPKYSHTKEYEVIVSNYTSKSQLDLLKKLLKTHKDNKLKIIKESLITKEATLLLTLCEGKNRQIRNICQDAELEVLSLKRLSIGNINITNLKIGQWRDIKSEILL